jgi:hypothetical protein
MEKPFYAPLIDGLCERQNYEATRPIYFFSQDGYTQGII